MTPRDEENRTVRVLLAGEVLRRTGFSVVEMDDGKLPVQGGNFGLLRLLCY